MRILLATVLAAAALGATTKEATDVTGTTATVNGTVTDATQYWFEYEATAADTPDDFELHTTPADGTGDVSAELTGLTPNTEYRFRVVASDGTDTVAGNTLTFTTTNPRPPQISAQRASDIRIETATVGATLDPRGSETTYYFEYGTNTRYGARTPDQTLAEDAGPTPVQAPLTGLQARTRYHWRLVATNAAGTDLGRDRTFITARLPASVSLGLSPRTVTWGRSLTLGGRVTGAGARGTPVLLESQAFPFSAAFAPIAQTHAGRDGGFLFNVDDLWTTTRYRVRTLTQAVAISPVEQASSAVLVGRHRRHTSRRRARIYGSVFPAVAGTATLQRRKHRRWRRVQRRALRPKDSVRAQYAFRVRRGKRHARRYRVVVTPDGATGHVKGRSRRVRVKKRPKPHRRHHRQQRGSRR